MKETKVFRITASAFFKFLLIPCIAVTIFCLFKYGLHGWVLWTLWWNSPVGLALILMVTFGFRYFGGTRVASFRLLNLRYLKLHSPRLKFPLWIPALHDRQSDFEALIESTCAPTHPFRAALKPKAD